MRVREEHVRQFIIVYRQVYRETITEDQAREMLYHLFALYEVVLSPLSKRSRDTP